MKLESNGSVKLTKQGIEIGGEYRVLLCGSLFYFRLPRAVWHDRIAKLKAAGYNAVDVYFPWNYHEKEAGVFDFTGERDVTCFLEELKAAGLYVVARPGPYICSEWNGGGIPARILGSGAPIRCADESFLKETGAWYSAILEKIAPFVYPAGPIVLLQLENELDFFDCPDPEAYIGALKEMAAKYISGIPFFCCAGQYHAKRAGGLTEGVEATLNCYPDSMDNTFDEVLAGYGLYFKEHEKPLLVSETNRDTFLLRRELSCGSKLLGAYNQVAGINFEYFQAVNNWGSPDAFIGTVYDFGSLLDAAGGYRPEAREAALFGAFLSAMGAPFAAALPEEETVIPTKCTFPTAAGGLRVLALEGGGRLVCVPNFGGDGEVEFSCGGRKLAGRVKGGHAPFYAVDVPLGHLGIAGLLTRANCELISAKKDQLVFCGSSPMVGLDMGEGEKLFTSDGETGGVRIRFVSEEQALASIGSFGETVYRESPLSALGGAALPVWKPAKGPLTEGVVRYRLKISPQKSLFIGHPADILRIDGKTRGASVHADGRSRLIPPAENGEYTVTVEKWGHSNFDDSQSPALRLSSGKGADSFGEAEEEKIGRCNFTLLDRYGEPKIDLRAGFPVKLGVDKWNSTRKPVICAYTLSATMRSDRLILKTGEKVDTAVYLDGELAGECDFGLFELTPFFRKGETRTLTLAYRKPRWTADVGSASLWQIGTVSPLSQEVLAGDGMAAMRGTEGKFTLPCTVESERAFHTHIDISREGFLKFEGKNLKLTCVADGRVVGRLLLGWENAPLLTGGDHDRIYLHPSWKELCIYAEALGPGAVLLSAAYLQ